MKTQRINYQYKKNLRNFKCQRGFMAVGVGLGLTALYGALGTLLVANHELNKSDDFLTENNFESQKIEPKIDVIDHEPSFVVGEIAAEDLSD